MYLINFLQNGIKSSGGVVEESVGKSWAGAILVGIFATMTGIDAGSVWVGLGVGVGALFFVYQAVKGKIFR